MTRYITIAILTLGVSLTLCQTKAASQETQLGPILMERSLTAPSPEHWGYKSLQLEM